MKLYTTDYAPNPRRVLWLMAEKGIRDIELVQVDIMSLAHRSHPGVLASGLPTLPVLELDDGKMIAESIAICRYLESLYPEPNLFGRDAREVAEIEMWQRRAEQIFANPLMWATQVTHPALTVLKPTNPPVAEFMLKMALDFAAVLDAHLKDHEFIAADRLTIADITAVCGLDFARIIKVRPDRDYEHLGRWAKMIRARPAAA